MAANKLIFQSADKAKAAITDAAKKDIAKLYSDWADEIGKKAEYYKTKTTASSWLQEQNMRQLQAQLTATSKQISNEVYGIAKDSIYKVSDAVVQANNKWLIDLGFPVDGVNSAFVSVPDQIVRRLITGQIYESGWSLSKSIWTDNEKTLKDIYTIVGKGLAQNMSAYDISKLLEAYVNPDRAKPWNLKMPDGVRIYKKSVDYNAQRLVRTLTQHGYQQSFIATTQDNPFVKDYIWRANGSRACILCAERDGKHYPKDALPMDHPNGMCTMEPNIDDDKMIDDLANWVNSPDGTYPEIDKFAKQFGYESSVKENVKSNQPANTHHVVQGKDITGTWTRRKDRFDFEIEDILDAQGFDGLPRVVPADEFDDLVKQANGGKGLVAQRAYSAPTQEILDEYREQLYNGKWYVDCSTGGAQYGQGMYAAADYTGELSSGIKEEMEHYKQLGQTRATKIVDNEQIDKATEVQWNRIKSDISFPYNNDGKILHSEAEVKEDIRKAISDLYGGEIEKLYGVAGNNKFDVKNKFTYTETLTLDPSAKIINYDELRQKKSQWISETLKEYNLKRDELINEIDKGVLSEDDAEEMLKPFYNKYLMTAHVDHDMDLGSFASMLGYDAINAEGHGASGSYTVILNRTKVIFKGE